MNVEALQRDPLTEKIVGAAIEVHRFLGPGLLESCYEQCLCYELAKLGLNFVRQQSIPIVYKEINLDCGFRADVIVENSVIIEIKSCDTMHPVFEASQNQPRPPPEFQRQTTQGRPAPFRPLNIVVVPLCSLCSLWLQGFKVFL